MAKEIERVSASADCELWKDVAGSRGKYQVSSLGRVRSFQLGPTASIMNPTINQWGYEEVKLSLPGGKKNRRVHRLVCAAFHGDGAGLEAAHLDGNRRNNCAGNLAWATRAEVVALAVARGTHQTPSTEGLSWSCGTKTPPPCPRLR